MVVYYLRKGNILWNVRVWGGINASGTDSVSSSSGRDMVRAARRTSSQPCAADAHRPSHTHPHPHRHAQVTTQTHRDTDTQTFNGEEEAAEELFKGHAENEMDAEKEKGGGFIVLTIFRGSVTLKSVYLW